MFHVAAFYRFADVPASGALRDRWYGEARKRRIKGTLLLANEGVNGTLAVPLSPEPLAEFLDQVVGAVPSLRKIKRKWAQTDKDPFRKLKVRLKAEIVTLGVSGTDPHKSGGKAVGVDRWNQLLADPDTLVLDTRNDYEVTLGSFDGAVNPKTASFRDFPAYVQTHLLGQKNRPIAMFCTGGIRCEKASAYLRDQGFELVYQLDGGILSYLAQVDRRASKWHGDCFVFDDRVAVTSELVPSGHSLCQACRQPLGEAERQDPRTVAGESCPACYGNKSAAAIASSRERYRQTILAAARGESHLKLE